MWHERKSVLAYAMVLLFLLSSFTYGAEVDKVIIYRDSFGVPHVYANTNESVFYGAGYAVAQDRLAQINQAKLAAEGRLAEMAGAEYLASDCQVRRDLGGLAQAQVTISRMTSPYREWIQAYSDGINRAIADLHMEGMVEPWTPADSVAISRYIVWEFSQGKTAEFERMAALNYLKDKFGKDKAEMMWRDLMSPVDPGAITTIPARTAEGAKTSRDSDPNLFNFSQRIQPANPPVSQPWVGSNAIVVAPERSATGKALLVSNTQLETHFPPVYYELHLHGGDFDVMGFTIPGFPAVGFGHNAKMAWTITVGCSDQQDVYEETIQSGPEGKLQYLFKGQWLDCITRNEKIPVKGYAEPVSFPVVSTIHGPIEMLDLSQGRAYATRWGPYLDGDSLIAYFEMDRAKNIDDFASALSKVEMSFNFLYADVDGNIAYWHAGEIPKRVSGHSGVMPVSGKGEFEWQGFVPFNQMPHMINPPEHIILLENNMPAPNSPAYDGSVTGWGTQRITRLKQLTDKLPEKVGMNDLERIFKDTRYLTADRLKPELLRVCRKQDNPRIREAAALLEKWDNSVSGDSPAATIFFVWLQKLGRNMLTDEFGETCMPSLIEKPHLPLIYHAFEGKTSLLPPSRDYFDNINTPNHETKDDIIAKSICDALDECEKRFGTPKMSSWRWSNFSYWDLGPFGKVADTYMDPNHHHVDVIGGGASSELIEVEAGFPNAHNLMPPGNCGDPKSPYANNQLDLFVNFKYKPMLFNSKEIRENGLPKTVLDYRRSGE
jgi:penicillin amidase